VLIKIKFLAIHTSKDLTRMGSSSLYTNAFNNTENSLKPSIRNTVNTGAYSTQNHRLLRNGTLKSKGNRKY